MGTPGAIRMISLIDLHTCDNLIKLYMVTQVAFEMLEDDASLLTISEGATELQCHIWVTD